MKNCGCYGLRFCFMQRKVNIQYIIAIESVLLKVGRLINPVSSLLENHSGNIPAVAQTLCFPQMCLTCRHN